MPYSPSTTLSSKTRPEEREQTRKTWLMPYIRLYKKELFYALSLGVATLAFSALLMFVAGWLITATSELPDGGIFGVYLPIIFVQIFGMGKPVLHYLERIFSHDWVFRMTSHMRLRLFNIVTHMTQQPTNKVRTGDVLGLISEDIGHVQNLYLRTLFPTIIAWVFYTLLVLTLGFIDLTYALVMLVLFILSAIISPLFFAKITKKDTAIKKAKTNELYADLTDNVIGASDWAFANRGDDYMHHYVHNYNEVKAAKTNLAQKLRLSKLILTIIFSLGAVATFVWATGFFGGQAGGTANWVAAFMLGFFPLLDIFNPLTNAIMQNNTYQDSLLRLNKLSENDVPVVDANNNENAAISGAVENPILELEHVSFRYTDESAEVLHDITLRIPHGQKVAILGASGSGKTTLLELLRAKLLPTSGNIFLGKNEIASLREHISTYISVIPQQTYIFNKSLRKNINITGKKISDEEILETLKSVELDNLVARLDKGLNTIVDESGTRFSGGERQRIALARALLARTPILLLDEPCTGLDPHTEQEVLNTLFRAVGDKTLLMVTHHLQGIEMFDRVLFIEDGQIVLDGSPAQLEQESERYRTLVAFDKGL